MKHPICYHSLSDSWLVVNIISIGLPNDIYPKEDKQPSRHGSRRQTSRKDFHTAQAHQCNCLGDRVTVRLKLPEGVKARDVGYLVSEAGAEWSQTGEWIETTTPPIGLHEVLAVDL
jgi:hypothetical protein